MVLTEKKRVPAVCGQSLSKGSENREGSAERRPQKPQKEDLCHPPPRPRPWGTWSSPNNLSRALPGETRLANVLSLCFPWPLSSHEETEDKARTHVCSVRIKQAVKKSYDTDVKVSTLMESGRCVFSWLLILMLWMLPTKPESFQLSPSANSKYCFHHTIHFWLNIY